MTFDIITQVRYNSKRLPAKVLLNFLNKNFLIYFINNLKKTRYVRKIILACPNDKYSEIFKFYSKKLSIDFFSLTGSENDVLRRYFYCAKKFSSKNIIRVTSDCPFINPLIINKMIEYYKAYNLEFLTNNKPRFVPLGFDCEIFSFNLLKKNFYLAKSKHEKEHVTPWIYSNIFKEKNNIRIFRRKYSNIRLTLDTVKDYLFFIKNSKILKKISTQKKIEFNLNKL